MCVLACMCTWMIVGGEVRGLWRPSQIWWFSQDFYSYWPEQISDSSDGWLYFCPVSCWRWGIGLSLNPFRISSYTLRLSFMSGILALQSSPLHSHSKLLLKGSKMSWRKDVWMCGGDGEPSVLFVLTLILPVRREWHILHSGWQTTSKGQFATGTLYNFSPKE